MPAQLRLGSASGITAGSTSCRKGDVTTVPGWLRMTVGGQLLCLRVRRDRSRGSNRKYLEPRVCLLSIVEWLVHVVRTIQHPCLPHGP